MISRIPDEQQKNEAAIFGRPICSDPQRLLTDLLRSASSAAPPPSRQTVRSALRAAHLLVRTGPTGCLPSVDLVEPSLRSTRRRVYLAGGLSVCSRRGETRGLVYAE